MLSAEGSATTIAGMVDACRVEIGGHAITAPVHVVMLGSQELILGWPFWRETGLLIYMDSDGSTQASIRVPGGGPRLT